MPSSTEIIAHIDGGSRGNPGPAAYGVAIKTADGQPVAAFGKFLGRTTNNFAEYQGLLAALDFALSHGYPRLRVLTDSELMARQVSGLYKVRSPDLKPLHDKAQSLIARLESFSIRHVYREQNREADRLVNQAMDDAARGVRPPPAMHRAPVQTVNEGGGAKPPSGAVWPAEQLSPRRHPTLFDTATEDAAAESPALESPASAFPREPAKPLVVSATYQQGALLPHTHLPLLDGEEVELRIRRKK